MRADAHRAAAALGREAVHDRVLDQRLHREHRHQREPRARIDVERDVQPLAEARVLEAQVLLDVLELFVERDELRVLRERVAEVLGEVDDEVVRAFGSVRVSAAMVVSVLNRKCGETRARSASSSAWVTSAERASSSAASSDTENTRARPAATFSSSSAIGVPAR